MDFRECKTCGKPVYEKGENVRIEQDAYEGSTLWFHKKCYQREEDITALGMRLMRCKYSVPLERLEDNWERHIVLAIPKQES